MIKKYLQVLLGLSIIAIFVTAVVFGLYYVWTELKSVDAKLAVGLVAGFATVIVSVITVVVGKRYDRKLEIEARFRELKVEIYSEFLSEIFAQFKSIAIGADEAESTEKLANFIEKWNSKVILWGGSDVLISYIKWLSHIRINSHSVDSFLLMGDFLLSLRKDLGLSVKGIDNRIPLYFILKNPELFVSMLSENPNVTFEEVAEAERKLGLE